MAIFVKAHKRAGHIVKSYMRPGRSLVQGSKTLGKIGAALRKAGTYQKKSAGDRWSRSRSYGVTSPGAILAAAPYEQGASIIKAQADVKRAIGRAILNRTGRSGGTYHVARRMTTGELAQGSYSGRRRYWGRDIQVLGPVSPYPRNTIIDYKAMVDPTGRFHNLQDPRPQSSRGGNSLYSKLYAASQTAKKIRKTRRSR